METTTAPTPPSADRGPPAGLIIRGQRPQDCEAIAELHNLPGFRFGTLRLPFETPEQVRESMEKTPPGFVRLVAVLDGKIVGRVGLHRLPGRQSHVGEIGIGVHNDWRGQGVGTALLKAAVDMADRWLGLRRLQLSVDTENEAAIRLYRRFGFEVEGTYRAFALRDGVLVDAFAMSRLHSI
ncbi:MAG: GNAT family N-acetyltransferase [Acetobacteraceae bacterium]|nr:GNAT family N-acetyltransferase [Acetobacteraceae bacterium]